MDARLEACTVLERAGIERPRSLWSSEHGDFEPEISSIEILNKPRDFPPSLSTRDYDSLIENIRSGSFKKAENIARQLIKRAPEMPSLHYNLCIALNSQGKCAEAEDILGMIARDFPSYPLAQGTMALRKLDADDIQGANEHLRTMMKCRKMNDQEYRMMVKVMLSIAKYERKPYKLERAIGLARQVGLDEEVSSAERILQSLRIDSAIADA